MGKSLLTEDKQKNPGEFTWGLPVLKILLVREYSTVCINTKEKLKQGKKNCGYYTQAALIDDGPTVGA
jgi:hypothetical protein